MKVSDLRALVLVGVVVVVLVVGGCGRDEHAGVASGAVCPTPQTLSYASFGKAFFASYCLRCHSVGKGGSARNGAPSDHNFDELAVIQGLAAHIDGYAAAGPAATNTAMPTDDPRPSLEERMKLGAWLACGAPP